MTEVENLKWKWWLIFTYKNKPRIDKYLKVTSLSHPFERTNENNTKNEEQGKTCWESYACNESIFLGFGSEEPFEMVEIANLSTIDWNEG